MVFAQFHNGVAQLHLIFCVLLVVPHFFPCIKGNGSGVLGGGDAALAAHAGQLTQVVPARDMQGAKVGHGLYRNDLYQLFGPQRFADLDHDLHGQLLGFAMLAVEHFLLIGGKFQCHLQSLLSTYHHQMCVSCYGL